jgi:hypothetical protein
MKERREWKTLHRMNSPVYIAGLRPYEWVLVVAFGFFIIFALAVAESAVKWILLIIPILFRSGLKIITKQNDAGHPDYLTSLFVWFQIPKHLLDTTNVFKILKEKSEQSGAKI